jgi:putative transposase
LQYVKEPVGRKAISVLAAQASQWLARLRDCEGKRVRHRFWQPGAGSNRNITSASALRAMIDYLPMNPVRRGLVAKAEVWEWSSARWFAGMGPGKLAMGNSILTELARDGILNHVAGRREVGEVKT